MATIYDCEASKRTKDMIAEMHDRNYTPNGGFTYIQIRQALGISMDGWRHFKNRRLTDWLAASIGYEDEYRKLCRMYNNHNLTGVEE